MRERSDLIYGGPAMIGSVIRRAMLAIFIALLFGSAGGGYCYAQSAKKTMPVYLDKNDPQFIAIKGRTITDLKHSADPESPENRLVAHKIELLTQEKKDTLEALLIESINDYTAQTLFDGGTLMRHFRALGEMEKEEIAKEHDIRVQYLGGNRYVAEFWEDGLATNSEAHALARARELAERHPDNKDRVEEQYANVRKSIRDGKQERYAKVMALLYTLESDGSTTFHDPFQSVIDFK